MHSQYIELLFIESMFMNLIANVMCSIQKQVCKSLKISKYSTYIFFYSINVELLNLQHVPVKLNGYQKKKNKKNVHSNEIYIFFRINYRFDLTVVDGVRHIYIIV